MALSRTRKRLLIWGSVLGLPVLLMVGCLAAFDAIIGKDEPIVGQSDQFPAPGGDWVATRELVDNGLGFGQGAVFDEVHVHRRGTPVTTHGDPSDSSVFYIVAGNHPPRVSWSDPTHLLIEYDTHSSQQKNPVPGRQLARHAQVAIAYRALP